MIDDYGRRTKKHLGQHFLIDQTVIHAIISAIAPREDQHFFEIGPGPGVLTGPLLPLVASLRAVELDADCVAFLKKKYCDYKHFYLTHQDILSFSFADCVSSGQSMRMVGNLPYNISSPILLRLLELRPILIDAHFMLQKEMAARLYAQPGTKDYGRLTVILARHFFITPVLDVPPQAFNPPPKVDSEVIRLQPHQEIATLDENIFSKVVRRAFATRRKMLRKSFQGVLTEQDWSALQCDSSQRPDSLTVQDYERIARYCTNHVAEDRI